MKAYFLIFKFIFLSLCLTIGTANAAVIRDLYRVSISPIAEQSLSVRDEAMQKGLNLVFTRVTGNSQIENNSTIAEAIQNPSDYVKQFWYTHDPKQNNQLILHIIYSESAVKQLLQNNQIPMWSEYRPVVLTWLVTNIDGKFDFLNGKSAEYLTQAIKTQALQRGVPVVFPSLDEIDLAQISPEAIAQGDKNPLQFGAARYHANLNLEIILTSLEPGNVSGNWVIEFQGKKQFWNIQSNDLNEFAKLGLDQVSDYLGSQLAVLSDTDQNQLIQLKIYGVLNLKSYLRIERYLKRLSGIQKLDLVELNGDECVFNAMTQGSISSIVNQLNVSHFLTAMNSDLKQNVSNTQGNAKSDYPVLEYIVQ